MPKRKSVGQRLRFEIFKRDEFKCQYCGRTPPVVVLELDHIVAIANDGDNSDINLITSCVDCNRGKGARSLNQVPESLESKIKDKKVRVAQLSAYNDFLMEVRANENATINSIGLYWFNQYKKEKNVYVFAGRYLSSLRTFLKYLPPAKIYEAIDIAFERMFPERIDDDYRTFRYFCGICWKFIKSEEGE
jgi:hypothetical protein